MPKAPKRIAVTGGAGQIAYSLLFRIAHGDLFGPDQPVILQILELPEAMQALEGVVMELEDCAFPLLQQVIIGSSPKEVFNACDLALLVGAKPRGPGMERAELLQENGKIFEAQGKALDAVAAPDVKILVVGNPCNTNCWIALQQAKRLSPHNFFAMTRLDQNRAMALLAKKLNRGISAIEKVVIWGNHSSTQVPDFTHATVDQIPIIQAIPERDWLEQEFVNRVQKRGAEIIAARGKSSAASAASAVVDCVRSLYAPTPKGQFYSVGLFSQRNPYGIDDNLIFSFPVRTNTQGQQEIVPGLDWDAFLTQKIKLSEKELIEEREAVLQQRNSS